MTAGTMTLLPPREGLCQTCATKHEPELPHNAQSLYYQTARHMQGLPANWLTATEHCTDDMRSLWREHLIGLGVDFDGGGVNPVKSKGGAK